MSVRPPGVAAGLTTAEARRRLAELGPNRIRERRREPLWEAFAEELREPMILLLLATGILYSVWGEPEDAATIFAVILTLVGVEVWNERRAERAISSLRELSEPTARAVRDGVPVEVPTHELVPGDVVLLEPGRRVPADGRLITAQSLAVDESALTGESIAVDKHADPEPGTPDPEALVFAGTAVVRGRAAATLIATGHETELGRVASLAAEAEPPRTPLQRAMAELSRTLVVVALSTSVLVPLLALATGDRPLRELVLVGLTLAFATIPEELPILVTMVLALGGYRLSKRGAVVKRLAAVEALGAVTFIATDKTGTLTEHRMRVSEIEPQDFAWRALELAALATGEPTSDPTELALLEAARTMGIDVPRLRAQAPIEREFSFEVDRRSMSVVVRRGGELHVVAKGAPEAIAERSVASLGVRGPRPLDEAQRRSIEKATQNAARRGLRLLAIAERSIASLPATAEEAEEDLVLVALVALADPPRPEAREAVAACRDAGIRVVMVTGDHPATARAIALEVGLEEPDEVVTGEALDEAGEAALRDLLGRASVFARISPAHKLRVVHAAREAGHVVAVTGDGVNDAAALAAADVGVAMGRTGTDVAREAADVVLADDDFATIVHAIEEGRTTSANLRKGVRYYLACKAALVAAMLLPALLGIPLPFAPVQVIFMELFMDLAASAAFVVEPGEPALMHRAPRDPRRRFLDREMLGSIGLSAAGLFAGVASAYLLTWYTAPDRARTVAFATWLLGHFVLAMNLRSEREPMLRLGLSSNRAMLAWGASTVLFVVAAIQVPALHGPLRTASLSAGNWATVIVAAVGGTAWIEVRKWIGSRSSSTA